MSIDPNNSERPPSVRVARSPRLSGSSGGGHYRRSSRSLASASLIPPASAYSPSLSSVSSAGRTSPPPLLASSASSVASLPPPALTQSPVTTSSRRLRAASLGNTPPSSRKKLISHDARTRAAAVRALEVNDAIVYLEGPAVYACQVCRTHLTTHCDIISKSFHGRRGRAYLFDTVVNITTGPPEDRLLITGLHAVCDLYCTRCRALLGWTYQRAYEPSQKYKEGKYILEKINLYLETSTSYAFEPPAGEHVDRWEQQSRKNHRRRASSRRGEDEDAEQNAAGSAVVYEYAP